MHTHSMQQVRRGVYTSSLGKWTQYAEQLKPIRKLLLPTMKRMLDRDELPFADSINWLLDPAFPYQNITTGTTTNSQATTQKKETTKTVTLSKGEERREGRQATEVDVGGQAWESESVQVNQPPGPSKWGERTGPQPKGRAKAKAKAKTKPIGAKGVPKLKPKAEGKSKGGGRVKVKPKARVKQEPLHEGPRGEATAVGRNGPVEERGRAVERKDTWREELQDLADDLSASLPTQVVQYLPTVQRALPYSSGEAFCDEISALGILLFNLGRLQDAISIFEPLVQHRPGVFSAYVGLASAYAMDSQLERSLGVLDRLLEELRGKDIPVSHDVYERRAQVGIGGVLM